MRWLLVLVLWAACAGPSAAQDAADGAGEAELRVLRAWFALEDSSQREACEKIFRAALADDTLGETLRIRAAIGLGRVERLDGRHTESRKRLEALVPSTENHPALRRILLEQIGPPRWFSAVRVFPTGQTQWHLDLDSGGMNTSRERGPKGGPEMSGSTFLVPTKPDNRMRDAIPPMSAKPWRQLRTDEGNVAYVQILATAPNIVVRFVTRIGGYGAVLPAPRRPF